MNAIGCMIGGGSASFGVMNTGYTIERVLESTDEILKENSYHFIKNYPNIPIIPPKIWENDTYLKNLPISEYDLLYANCPCSGLSAVNRNMSLENEKNKNFYRVFNVINKIKPKTFLIENAPALVSIGFPIIQDMIKLLPDYKFSIVRDASKNHEVAMPRFRIMIFGWKRNIFNDSIPEIDSVKKSLFVKDVIGDLYDVPLGGLINHDHNLLKKTGYEPVYKYVKCKESSAITICQNEKLWDLINPKLYNTIKSINKKSSNFENYWDKTPYRIDENYLSKSLTGMSHMIHPKHDRELTVREYARLMNYPDTFEFFPGGGVPVIQCIVKGVAGNFIKWATEQIKRNLNNKDYKKTDKIIIYQNNCTNNFYQYTENEFCKLTSFK